MDRTHRLSVSRQARLLGMSRDSVYDWHRPPRLLLWPIRIS